MSDVFISYARSTESVAGRVAEALRAHGHAVWWDHELPAHRAYAEVIEERLRASKAVVVVWSVDAAKSQWVRAEADVARVAGRLVQINIDGCTLPLPFNQIQCIDLSGWNGDTGAHGWHKVVASVGALLNGMTGNASRAGIGAMPMCPHAAPVRETLLAVLAFDNLSNDPDLSYFSDGVSEEILYTVARAKGLRVIGEASSFQFRGPDKTAEKVVDALGATHMLDGSVRRAGNNIRINVELVDTASLETLWSERYDRALTDIFALQDEIAGAIATALDHHFAPTRTPITIDPAAYDLYLQARAIYALDLQMGGIQEESCVALLEGAVSRAPDFAEAWGRLAIYRKGEAKIAAARRGLELDPNCATSLAALAMTKPPFAQHAEKLELAERAYELTPDDQLVAGVYTVLLVSFGFLTRACEVSLARLERDPLSPMVAGGLAAVYRSLGRNAEAIAVADRAMNDFPDADYVKFIRGIIAIFDGDIELATSLATAPSTTGEAVPLQVLTMFMRTVGAMAPADRAMIVGQFLQRGAPKSFIVDIGLAGAMGEVDLAFDNLLETIREGRRLEFTADNDGRAAGNDVAVTSGLFMPNCEALRRDVRFAEVCVRLGLYDCWRDTGLWPDCVAEIAPFYDFKAECAKLAGTVAPYIAQAKG